MKREKNSLKGEQKNVGMEGEGKRGPRSGEFPREGEGGSLQKF